MTGIAYQILVELVAFEFDSEDSNSSRKQPFYLFWLSFERPLILQSLMRILQAQLLALRPVFPILLDHQQLL